MIAEPFVGRGGSADRLLDCCAHPSDTTAGKEANPAVEFAGTGDGARPVTTLDHADVEIDRVFDPFPNRMNLDIHPRIEVAKRQNDRHRLYDRVYTLPGMTSMDSVPHDLHPEPEHPEVRLGIGGELRLRHQRRVRAVAETRGERSVARAFFFNHAVDGQITTKCDPQIAQQSRQKK